MSTHVYIAPRHINRGQKITVSVCSLLPPCGPWENQTQVVRLGSRHFLPTEPSFWLMFFVDCCI